MSSGTALINQKAFTAMLSAQLNAAMTEAAEPIIQAALKEAEKEMRTQWAAKLVGFIASYHSVQYMRDEILITVGGDTYA
jgi:3-dehydroquinate synthetase